jgi:hypothetical protein
LRIRKTSKELLIDENREHRAYKNTVTPQSIIAGRSEGIPRVIFFTPDFAVVVGLPAEVPVAPVTPTTVPAPSVFAAPFCDVVVASNASIDRAVTVSSSPIAV